MQTGAWTPFKTDLSEDQKKVFTTATKDLMGVGYQPIAVATQVVAGTNYSYFCNATLATPAQDTYTAMVNVYQQTDGSVHLTEIRRVQD